MDRILEPELMEDEMQTLAYSNADFSQSNQIFVNKIKALEGEVSGRILDIGCGPGDVDLLLAESFPTTLILGIDGSKQMIDLANEKVNGTPSQGRITFQKDRLPGLNVQPGQIDLIVSKDLLHHIPDPMVFWKEVDRIAGFNTSVMVMDLIRPTSEAVAQQIVETIAAREADILKVDFYNSLLAAFTLEEIHQQMNAFSFDYELQMLGDRHFFWKGRKRIG